MYGIFYQIEPFQSLKKCMVPPDFLFKYQEHLLSSAFSEYGFKPCKNTHVLPLETRVSRYAENVGAVTKVGTVLKYSDISFYGTGDATAI